MVHKSWLKNFTFTGILELHILNINYLPPQTFPFFILAPQINIILTLL